MTPKRKHDYALLRQILQDQPGLEKNAAELAREYARRHPLGIVISKASLRAILRDHGAEVLGRQYEPGPGHARAQHDHDLIKRIVREDPDLIDRPSDVARAYTRASGRPINRVYMAKVLRGMREELRKAASRSEDRVPLGDLLPPLKVEAVNRFAEVLRIYQETDPREHDLLHSGTSTAYYADILTDAIHWAQFNGISVETAMISAWETVLLEKAK